MPVDDPFSGEVEGTSGTSYPEEGRERRWFGTRTPDTPGSRSGEVTAAVTPTRTLPWVLQWRRGSSPVSLRARFHSRRSHQPDSVDVPDPGVGRSRVPLTPIVNSFSGVSPRKSKTRVTPVINRARGSGPRPLLPREDGSWSPLRHSHPPWVERWSPRQGRDLKTSVLVFNTSRVSPCKDLLFRQ